VERAEGGDGALMPHISSPYVSADTPSAQFLLQKCQELGVPLLSISEETRESLMAAGLPRIREVVRGDGGECMGEKSEFSNAVNIDIPGKGKAAMSALRVNCFQAARAKSNMFQGEDQFYQSVMDSKALPAGGISGAEHFITKDNRFYLKTIPNHAEVGVLRGKFLPDYVDHLQKSENSLLTRMNALLKFEIPQTWTSNIIIYVLVMDNGKYDIGSDDSVVTFDLKGSKWKHRWKADGGIRCSPLFPLAFWKDKDIHTAEGEDIDFFRVADAIEQRLVYQERVGDEN